MKAGFLLVLLTAAAISHADMITLDFEGLANNVKLTTQYAHLGATFTSADTYTSIRSTTGYQPYPAFSGQTVLTTKTLGLTTVSFSHDVANVSLRVLSPFFFGAELLAYDASGASLDTASAAPDPDYQELKVSGTGIRSITIQAPAGFAVFDDLSYTAPVPEPASFVALGLGLAALRRRKR